MCERTVLENSVKFILSLEEENSSYDPCSEHMIIYSVTHMISVKWKFEILDTKLPSLARQNHSIHEMIIFWQKIYSCFKNLIQVLGGFFDGCNECSGTIISWRFLRLCNSQLLREIFSHGGSYFIVLLFSCIRKYLRRLICNLMDILIGIVMF